MDKQEIKLLFTSYEGVLFTSLFTLIFIVTNLIMVDYRGVLGLVTDQTPFFILVLIVTMAYLFKNSKVEAGKVKIGFLIIWFLYVTSIFASMMVTRDFVWTEALVWILLTMIFFFRQPKELLFMMTAGAILSLPSLLLQDYTLNESGATLVLVYAAGLIFIPKKNMTVSLYVLPMFILLMLVTTSRTAIGIFILVTIVQFMYINFYQRSRRHQKRFLISLGSISIVPVLIFLPSIYRFFMAGSISTEGVDWNRLTSGRFDVWVTVLNNSQWFGDGRGYVDFTELLHVHNILLDTLGRYGVITAILFTVLLSFVFVISTLSIRTFNMALFIFAFILIGMFEYNYLFMFVYFSPVILFFVIINYLITVYDDVIRENGKLLNRNG